MATTDTVLAQKPTKPLPQRICRFLAGEGYWPRLDPEAPGGAAVSFKGEGRTFLVRFDERDEAFVQFCAGVLLEGTSRDELTHLRVAQAIQAETKVARGRAPGPLPGRG